MRFAEVAVDAPAAGRRLYSYEVPPNLSVLPGMLVWVPFGNQVRQGLVFSLAESTTVVAPRRVAALVYDFPILDQARRELAIWLAHEYLCSYFAAVELMLPPAVARTARLRELVWRIPEADATDLTRHQQLVIDRLPAAGAVPITELRQVLPATRLDIVLEQLERKGLIGRRVEAHSPAREPKVEPHWRLALPAEAAEARLAEVPARRRLVLQRVVDALGGGPLPDRALRAAAKARPEHLLALSELGIVQAETEPVVSAPPPTPAPWPTLTPRQAAVWQQIRLALTGGRAGTFLLHGVTGSGKTEVYLRAAAAVVQQGRQAIVLVPEIALTPQTLQRFNAHFPGRVVVLHSQLTAPQRREAWWRVQRGLVNVVVGSRSAIFAPVPDLGLIVVDEEHEWSYKQHESEPRYHARDVAIRLGQLKDVPVLLGSATPDVETYRRARRGEYRLLTLSERISAAVEPGEAQPTAIPLPEVEVVDMRRELRDGNTGIFSRRLEQEMREALSAGSQVILFLNRRGTATVVTCRSCGYVVECRSCAMSMAFHSDISQLVCHLCNRRRKPPVSCPKCGDRRIRMLGTGTQRVEAQVRELFPGARVVRWDRDTARNARAHEEMLEQFLQGEADVLVGTQMVAKGLNLPKVSLVGVVLADVGLHLPDLRAAERTFQLLEQVAGRAGRTARGRAILQTYSPDHYVIAAARDHDYETFARRELAFRREHLQPPYRRLVRLLYRGSSEQAAQREAMEVAEALDTAIVQEGLVGLEVLGPAPCYLRKVRSRWRWHIILRGEGAHRLLEQFRLPRGWSIDADPVSLL